MVKQFVQTLKNDSELLPSRVANTQREEGGRRSKEGPVDKELASAINAIKRGQGWQSRIGQKMTLKDKMLVFGLLEKQKPSQDLAIIK